MKRMSTPDLVEEDGIGGIGGKLGLSDILRFY